MTDVDGLVERLERDNEWLMRSRVIGAQEAGTNAREAAATLRQLQSDLTAAKAERDELRKALEPFARVFAEKMRDYPDGSAKSEPPDEQHAWGFNSVDLTWGDFRAARRLIERETR